jgi:hypothetical protein
MDGRFDVPDALILVELAHQVERTLEFGFDVRIELHSGFEAPEQVGGHGEIAFLSQLVALAPDTGIDAEDFLDDDDRRFRLVGRTRDISLELAIVFESLDAGEFGHLGCSFRFSALVFALKCGLSIAGRHCQTQICTGRGLPSRSR